MRVITACVVLLFSFFIQSGFAQEVAPETLHAWNIMECMPLIPPVVSDFQAPPSLSVQGAEFIKVLEGFSAKAYKDSRGYSIGYGFQKWQGRPTTRRYPGVVTREQSDREFDRQIVAYENIVMESLDGMEVTQHEFDALVSVCYNLGVVNRAILVKLRNQRRVMVSDFVTTAKVRHRVHPIVYGRRLKEYVMFLGQYEDALNLPVKNWKQMRMHYTRLNSRGVPHARATSAFRQQPALDEARLVAPTGIPSMGAEAR